MHTFVWVDLARIEKFFFQHQITIATLLMFRSKNHHRQSNEQQRQQQKLDPAFGRLKKKVRQNRTRTGNCWWAGCMWWTASYWGRGGGRWSPYYKSSYVFVGSTSATETSPLRIKVKPCGLRRTATRERYGTEQHNSLRKHWPRWRKIFPYPMLMKFSGQNNSLHTHARTHSVTYDHTLTHTHTHTHTYTHTPTHMYARTHWRICIHACAGVRTYLFHGCTQHPSLAQSASSIQSRGGRQVACRPVILSFTYSP